jgi:hypothetical protein
VSIEEKMALMKILIREEKNVALLEEMFQDKLPPEAKELEIDQEITNKESAKDSDYQKYTKNATEKINGIKKYGDVHKISRMRFEQFEQEDEKQRLKREG